MPIEAKIFVTCDECVASVTLYEDEIAELYAGQTLFAIQEDLSLHDDLEGWEVIDKLQESSVRCPACLLAVKIEPAPRFYDMTNRDYTKMVDTPPSDMEKYLDENFGPGYATVDDAVVAQQGEMLVDGDDTAYETTIVDNTGKPHIIMWMSNGQVWIQPYDSSEARKGLSYYEIP